MIAGLQYAKRDFRTFAYSVVSDQPALSAQASPRRHFTTPLDFCATADLLLTEKIHKTESIVSDQPVRTAQADLKRHFTQTSESPFSRVARQLEFDLVYSFMLVRPLQNHCSIRNNISIHISVILLPDEACKLSDDCRLVRCLDILSCILCYILMLPYIAIACVWKPFPKRWILDCSKLKEFADDNFKFDKNGRKFSK